MASYLYPEVGEQRVDQATVSARQKAQAGLPLTPAEMQRISNRESIDRENARGQSAGSPLYPEVAMGPRGIDVNAYTGSMWNGTARPLGGNSARNAATQPAAPAVPPGAARPYAPAPLPNNPLISANDAARFRATEMSTAATSASMAEQARAQRERERNAGAVRGAIAPIEEPGGTRPRTAAEGAFIYKDPNIALAPTRRDPSAREFLTNYIKGGGTLTGEALDYSRTIDKQPKETKPMPGSAGYQTIEIPGVGKLVRDSATGEAVEGGRLIKPPEAKPEAKPSEAEVAFDTNITEGLAKIREYRDTVKNFGNWESRFGNSKAKAALEQIPYQLAIMHAKIADPSSVAREGEVAAAQKYMLPSGFWTGNDNTLAALDGLENTFNGYSEARKKARGVSAPAPAAAAAKPAEAAPPAAVKSKAARDALPVGARYIGLDGKTYTKK